MAFNINLFAGALKLGGARTSLFQVNITNPANGAADIQVPFLARAAQIPAATIAPLDVPYFGRQLRLAGNRTFADWTATIINDEDMQIRNAMSASFTERFHLDQQGLPDFANVVQLSLLCFARGTRRRCTSRSSCHLHYDMNP